MASTTSSSPQISPISDQDISPTAYATLFTLSSIVLVLVITSACYNVFRAHPTFDQELGLSAQQSARKRGLDEETLGSYPRMSFSRVKNEYWSSNGSCSGFHSGCSICLAEYKEVDIVLLLPNCGHFFHVKCVDQWLRLCATCPICRNSPVSVFVQADGSLDRQELGERNNRAM